MQRIPPAIYFCRLETVNYLRMHLRIYGFGALNSSCRAESQRCIISPSALTLTVVSTEKIKVRYYVCVAFQMVFAETTENIFQILKRTTVVFAQTFFNAFRYLISKYS